MFRLILLVLPFSWISGKTLDNQLIGTPSVSCGPESLSISAESEDVFEGQVYIKSARRSSADCYSLYEVGMNSKNPRFNLSLSRISSCGLEMRRMSDSSRSVQLSAVVVFSFHPSFVTGGDRAFAVHCLFMQGDQPVRAGVDFIDDIHPIPLWGAPATPPTVSLDLVPGRVPSETSPSSPVEIGQPLMLVWKLESDSMVYGIRILDCAAEAPDGKRMEVLRGGCSTDRGLLSDVRYSDDLHRGFSDAIAFRFPDEMELSFRCHVQICIRKFDHLILTGKSEDHLCGEAPPCLFSADERIRRSAHFSVSRNESLMTSSPMVIEVVGRLPGEPSHTPAQQLSGTTSIISSSSLCLNKTLFAFASTVSVTVYTVTVASIIMFVYSKMRSKCT